MASISTLDKAAAKAELEWRRSERDCHYFIDHYVKIEDRDSPDLVIQFAMWKAQRDTLDAILNERLTIILKARQLGFSWLALAYATWRILFKPGYSVVALSKTDKDAKELVRRVEFILRYLPKWMTREKKIAGANFSGPVWESTTEKVEISHPKGEPSTFQSMPASQDAGRSFTASLVIQDEWAFQQWADTIWAAAYPTINRPTGGQVIGLSTAKRGTLFEVIWNKARKGENTFKAIFVPWWADPRRDEAWYEQTKKDLPNTYRAEYPATEEEAFTVGQGAFFPEWDTRFHVVREWRPPREWRRYRGFDPGFSSNACCKWYAVSPDGWAVAYREYYPTQVIDADQAEEIKRLSKYDDGEPEKIEYTVADPSAWAKKSSTGESTAEIFANHGVPMIPGDNDLENGWRRLHEWLKVFPGADGENTAMLRFAPECANTIRTYPSCEQKKTNPEDISDQSEHHPQDVDRYFVMSRPRPTKVPEKELTPVQKHKKKLMERKMQNKRRIL